MNRPNQQYLGKYLWLEGEGQYSIHMHTHTHTPQKGNTYKKYIYNTNFNRYYCIYINSTDKIIERHKKWLVFWTTVIMAFSEIGLMRVKRNEWIKYILKKKRQSLFMAQVHCTKGEIVKMPRGFVDN